MRIEYAGFELQPGENAPALTLAGCGSATEVDFVQAHRSLGDGVRVLGGSVDLRHVVSTLAARDSFDWSDGWVGRAQFLIAQRPGDDALDGRSNQANPGAEPVSQPVVYNATLIGSSGTGNGIEFRSGSGGLVRNAILAGHGGVSVDVIGDDSAARYGAGALDVAASLFFENGAAPGYDDWPEGFDADLFDEQDVFTPPPTGNTFGVDPLLGQPLDENAPDFAPAPGSPALSGGATPPGDGFFDTAATYRGALDAQNGWLASWTAYPTSQTPVNLPRSRRQSVYAAL